MFSLTTPSRHLRACSAVLISLAGAGYAGAADMPRAVRTSNANDDIRIVPQVQAGTAGFEPGVALEWRSSGLDHFVIRPEVNLSEDERVGGGAALLYDLRNHLDLPSRHNLSVGPRFVFHNSDDTGAELDFMATYGVALSEGIYPWRHAVGLLATVGVRDDRKHDEMRLGASAGAFYSFRF